MIMNKVKAFLRLTRIEHSIMLIIAITAAELLAYKFPSLIIYIISIISPSIISMASFIINDYYDYDIDKINNKPNPISEGIFSKSFAFNTSIILFIIGSIISLGINIYAFLIASIFSILAFLYSYKLKLLTLLGNAYIALAMAIPFLYAMAVDLNYSSLDLIIFFIIFFSGLGREIHGTIRDIKGDSIRGVKSLPMIIGTKNAAVIASIFYSIAIVLSYTIYLLKPFNNLTYLILISIVNIILIYVNIIFIKENNKKYKLARNLSLSSMAFALIIFLIFAFQV